MSGPITFIGSDLHKLAKLFKYPLQSCNSYFQSDSSPNPCWVTGECQVTLPWPGYLDTDLGQKKWIFQLLDGFGPINGIAIGVAIVTVATGPGAMGSTSPLPHISVQLFTLINCCVAWPQCLPLSFSLHSLEGQWYKEEKLFLTSCTSVPCSVPSYVLHRTLATQFK